MRTEQDNLRTGQDDLTHMSSGATLPDGADGRPGAWRSAAALVEAVRSGPSPLSPDALSRVRRGVLRRLHGRGLASLVSRRRHPLSAGAVAAVVLLSTVGAGAALWRYRHVEPPVPEVGEPSVAPLKSPKAARHRGPRRVAAPEVALVPSPASVVAEEAPPVPAPVPEATPATAPAPQAPPSTARRSPRQVAPPAAPADSEARLLALALAQIRQQHDPQAALATLDRLESRFPRGVLANEARATRIEAAVAAKDLRTATRMVEATAIPDGRSGVAILVMRGELRAEAGRCADAVADFTAVLDQTELSAGPLAERALRGRAVCFQRLGQTSRAREDLRDLRRAYPDGRFGREATSLLEDSAP